MQTSRVLVGAAMLVFGGCATASSLGEARAVLATDGRVRAEAVTEGQPIPPGDGQLFTLGAQTGAPLNAQVNPETDLDLRTVLDLEELVRPLTTGPRTEGALGDAVSGLTVTP